MPVKYGSEEMLHQQVADYLRLQYPDKLFHSDFGSGIKLTMGQATKQKRLQGGRRSWPDLFIAEPRITRRGISGKLFNCDLSETLWLSGDEDLPYEQSQTFHVIYCGLFIELKKEGTTIYKKNGELVANEHIREQASILEELRQRGYKAEFGIGFENTKEIIDDYMKGVVK